MPTTTAATPLSRRARLSRPLSLAELAAADRLRAERARGRRAHGRHRRAALLAERTRQAEAA